MFIEGARLKKYFSSLLIVFAVAALIAPATAFADWKVYYTGKAAAMFGSGGRGSFATQGQCDAYRAQSPGFEQSNSYCSGFGASTVYYGGRQTIQTQMIGNMLAPVFQSLFTLSDNSQQEQYDAQVAERAKAAEVERQKAIKEWWACQRKAALDQEREKNARRAQGEKVIGQMQTVGGEHKLEPFRWGNTAGLKPLTKTYPTAQLSEWEKLICSAYFSNLAKKSKTDVDGKFYAEQADRVMEGAPTYVECEIPKASNEKLARKIAATKKAYEAIDAKIKELEALDENKSKQSERDYLAKKEELEKELDRLRIAAQAE